LGSFSEAFDHHYDALWGYAGLVVRPGSGEIKGRWAIEGAQSGDLPLQFRHPNVFDVLCQAEGRLCEAVTHSSDL
jgi:hypothetical protein